MNLVQLATENVLLVVPLILAGARGFVPWLAGELMIGDLRRRRRFQARHIALTPSSVTFAEAGFATTAFLSAVVHQKSDGSLLFFVAVVEFLLFAFALRDGDASLRAESGNVELVRSYAFVVVAFVVAAVFIPRP